MTDTTPDPLTTTTAALAAALLRSPLWPLLAVGSHVLTIRVEKNAEGLAYLEPTQVGVAPEVTISPDCRDGKHHACRGDAWSHTLDEPSPCACSCHEPAAVGTSTRSRPPTRPAAA